MWLRLAALAACAMLPCAQAWAASPADAPSFVPEPRAAQATAIASAAVPSIDPSTQALTLDEAFARVARAHPDLRLFDAQRRVRDAERDEAALRPARSFGIEVEGLVLNDGGNRIDTLETTLGLASVFERGGKLDARRALAQSRIDALAIEREQARIDLLAETARRHLDVVDAQRQQAIAGQDIAQRRRVVDAARRRFQAGASPEAVILSAQAAQAQAELQAARASQQFERARRSLAVLWGEAAPTFAVAEVDPLAVPAIEAFDVLAARLQRAPELLQFNDQQRIAESRLRLARAQAVPDVEWQAGIRHARDGNDVSLLGGFSIPLGQRARAEPGIRAAQAELEVLSLQREAGGLSLLSTLADAHGRYAVARDEVQRLRDDVLPKLVRAEAETERAWRAGAVSHLEWAQLQDERIAALRQQLAAAIEAQAALIELQRLTGQPLLAPAEGGEH